LLTLPPSFSPSSPFYPDGFDPSFLLFAGERTFSFSSLDIILCSSYSGVVFSLSFYSSKIRGFRLFSPLPGKVNAFTTLFLFYPVKNTGFLPFLSVAAPCPFLRYVKYCLPLFSLFKKL